MKLRDWLKAENVSIKSFSEQLGVERAMVYRYFTGAMPRARTIRRIELLTGGAVTAQDFYDNAMEHRNNSWKQPREHEPLASQTSPSVSTEDSPNRGTPHSFAWPDLSGQNLLSVPAERVSHGFDRRTGNDLHRPATAVLSAAITHYILDRKGIG